MNRWSLGLVALALPACTAAVAGTVSHGPSAVTVTIYHNDGLATSDLVRPDASQADEGLALITETREIDLPAGLSEIRFRGVASTMVPQSANIEGLPEGTLERNFDYDLLSPGSLLAKSIGQTVHLIRTDPKTGKRTQVQAIVRTGPAGVMLEIDGKLEALGCSGLPEKLVLDKAPDGLTDVPTLAIRTHAPAAGHYKVRLTYIATGLNWSADYVAHVRPGGHALDLTGWLTLANFGSTSFAHIPLQAVAGRLNATGDDLPIHPAPLALATQCWPTDISWGTRRLRQGPPDIQYSPVAVTALTSGGIETLVVTGSHIDDPRALGDYKIYTLPEPTDLPARETKQVEFLDLHDIPFERIYRYQIDQDNLTVTNPTAVTLRLRNVAIAGLGKPMPAGTFAVTEPGPDGSPVFIGQSAIRDTPVGVPFEIATGEVFSVLVRQTLIDEKKNGSRVDPHIQRTFDLDVGNSRTETVVFELAHGLDYGQGKILSESQPHTVDRGNAVWRLTLSPGQHVHLQIGLEYPG